MTAYKSNQSAVAWLIVGLIALLGLNGYQWYVNNQLKGDNNRQQNEMYELEKVQAELERDYQASLESIENLRDDTKELNKLIDSQKSELRAQKDKINALIWSKRELDKAREEIKNFKVLTEQYVEDINSLKAENERLMASNRRLKTENTTLTTDLTAQREINEELSQAKTVLASQKEELESHNTELAAKVEVGSAIKINYMEFKGFEVKDDGKLKKKKMKAKKVDLIRTCFRTETNVVTPAGEETFYLRIINPQGETMAVESLGSGVLTDKLTDTKVRYTKPGTIDYANTDTEGCIDWQPNFAFQKGNYEVELYNKGYMVGKGNFRLK